MPDSADAPALTRTESIVVDASPEAIYDLVSDVTRTGEWSPICAECWWEEPEHAGEEGAWFGGRNETPERTWETRSVVVAADRPREFAWQVGGALVRWAYVLRPIDGATTEVTEQWDFLPGGLEHFATTYGDRADEEIAERSEAARRGIPETLATIKRVAEGGPEGGPGGGPGPRA